MFTTLGRSSDASDNRVDKLVEGQALSAGDVANIAQWIEDVEAMQDAYAHQVDELRSRIAELEARPTDVVFTGQLDTKLHDIRSAIPLATDLNPIWDAIEKLENLPPKHTVTTLHHNHSYTPRNDTWIWVAIALTVGVAFIGWAV